MAVRDVELSVGTLKNRMAHLRWWVEKVGKAGVIPADNALLAIPQRQFVTNEDKAQRLDDQLDRISDPYVRMSLALQQAFGLRREESIKFQPRLADRGDRIVLKGSWAPKELIELESRIAHLRARLRSGDPDMTSDEIEAAIVRAEAKRAELVAVDSDPKESARLLAVLPNAAELYRRQTALGLAGDPRATPKARLALRNLLGTIQLEQGEATAFGRATKCTLPRSLRGAGSRYRGDSIRTCDTYVPSRQDKPGKGGSLM